MGRRNISKTGKKEDLIQKLAENSDESSEDQNEEEVQSSFTNMLCALFWCKKKQKKESLISLTKDSKKIERKKNL